ncbi:MAG TPA: DUF4212 domain-containing protein [Telluria sp.]
MQVPHEDAGLAARRLHALVTARALHWRRTRTITGALLALWLATTFGTVFFARELQDLSLFGWPVSFYFAAQGSLLIYLAIIGGYAWCMRRADREFDQRQRELA